jgi:hypothetical protein
VRCLELGPQKVWTATRHVIFAREFWWEDNFIAAQVLSKFLFAILMKDLAHPQQNVASTKLFAALRSEIM